MEDPGQAEFIRWSLRNAGIGATVALTLVGGLPAALVVAIITAAVTDEKASRLWQSPETRLHAEADRRAKEVLRMELARRRIDTSPEKLNLWLRLAKAARLTSGSELRKRHNRG